MLFVEGHWAKDVSNERSNYAKQSDGFPEVAVQTACRPDELADDTDKGKRSWPMQALSLTMVANVSPKGGAFTLRWIAGKPVDFDFQPTYIPYGDAKAKDRNTGVSDLHFLGEVASS